MESLEISSAHFWASAAITAALDAGFILLLAWRIKPARFRQLRWPLVGASAVLWGGFSILLELAFWGTYYQYFFPGWLRSGGILLFVPLLYGFFALAFHWLALRAPLNPILGFCLLGGLESVIEHLGGIYGLKILAVPMLQGASPLSILAFSFPEYVFYWCVVIAVAALLDAGWRKVKNLRRGR